MEVAERERLDLEWITLSAIRDVIRISTNGDTSQGSYRKAIALGEKITPDILGSDVSLLRQSRELDLTKEFRQKARYKSMALGQNITPLDLVIEEIDEYKSYLKVAKDDRDKKETDKLENRLKKLYEVKDEIEPSAKSENQLIFRDALMVDRGMPVLFESVNCKSFQIDSESTMTIRVLHPEKPEHITGTDLIYEMYNKERNTVTLAFIQYKIWEDRKLYLSDERMSKQIQRMRYFLCDKGVCFSSEDWRENGEYRFPACSAFLRPTDKLQSSTQKLYSTGEYLPICFIDKCKTTGSRGGLMLDFKSIRRQSVSQKLFENLFNQNKLGSRELTLDELASLYKGASILSEKEENMLIYVQQYPSEF